MAVGHDVLCGAVRLTPAALDKLDWIYNVKGVPIDAEAIKSAVAAGSEGVMRWLQQHGAVCNQVTCCTAARHGNLEVMQLLRDAQCPQVGTVTEAAVSGGDLDALRWLLQHGCPVNYNIVRMLLQAAI